MASKRKQFILSLATLAVVGSSYFAYTLFAAQAQNSTLAQAPMNSQVQVPPAFIMAVDDSGSMTFQHQFPIADGYGCWDQSTASFFSSPGVVRDSGTSCRYAYSYTSIRNGWEYHGIPPIDAFGFSRSSDFNPSYFDPTVRYLPWSKSDGTDYPQASTTSTRVHPESASPAIQLTSDLERANDDTEFFLYRGMTLPSGTRFRRAAACTNAGSGFPNNNNWLTLSSAYTVPGTAYTQSNTQYRRGCRIYVRHWPATFFTRYGSSSDPRPTMEGANIYSAVTRVRVANACGTGCDLWKYTIQSTNTAALQNFANWFSFYGNRQRAMIAGMTRSMASVNNMRVGYFTINSGHDGSGSNESDYDEYDDVVMYDMAVPGERESLYTSMVSLDASGSTPNLPATNHLGSQFQRDDAGAPVQLACQRNAGMLFTDGYSNVSGSAEAIAGLGAPFDPTPANSLAAIASQFYFDTADGDSPLRADMPAGRVPVPAACASLDPSSVEWKKLDCQSNLHMNFYGVTLGGRGETYDPELNQDPYVLNPGWPGYSSGSRSTVDDIWHAAVNTRGDFISARTPADITAAMRRILATVSSGSSPSGSVAITGARIGTGSLTVIPRYQVENEGTDWSSTLEANRVRMNPSTRLPELLPAWEASSKFPAAGSRDIFFTRNNTTQEFSSSNVSFADLCSLDGCTAGEVTALGAGSNLANAIGYLKGDVSLEKRNNGPFRDRTTILGDIVNSTPVVSAPTDDYGYAALGGTLGSSYRSYVQTTKASRRYMVYVGANDGMLHAFDGGLTKAMAENGDAPDSSGGREEFAYIPATSLGHLGNLLFPYDPENDNDQKFRHRYYVDGPLSVSDAYYGGGWKTVLVGTAGAGGRGVFALDVSTPASFGVSDRLWEISNLNTSLTAAVRNNIGHVLGKPVIVPVKNTAGTVTWKAIFGNGYQSASGKAVLFMVDIGTGSPAITMLEAQETASGLSATSSNGLGNIVVVDRWMGSALGTAGRDGYADTVYAADQQGALWKFDIRAVSPSNITVPLFKTQEFTEGGGRYRQPILGGLTAASGPGGGVMIYFGTGSFSFLHDPADTSAQSLYAINDIERGPTTATLELTSLVRYTVATVAGTDRTVTRQTSPPLAPKGWYVNLSARERFVGNPAIASGVLFMPTYTPDASSTASSNAGCSTGGFNALFGLNARTGSAALSKVRYGSTTGTSPAANTASVALNTGGTAPVKDVGVMAIPRLTPPTLVPPPPGTPPTAPPSPPEQGCWMMVTAAGAQSMFLPYPCGRQSWRQIE